MLLGLPVVVGSRTRPARVGPSTAASRQCAGPLCVWLEVRAAVHQPCLCPTSTPSALLLVLPQIQEEKQSRIGRSLVNLLADSYLSGGLAGGFSAGSASVFCACLARLLCTLARLFGGGGSSANQAPCNAKYKYVRCPRNVLHLLRLRTCRRGTSVGRGAARGAGGGCARYAAAADGAGGESLMARTAQSASISGRLCCRMQRAGTTHCLPACLPGCLAQGRSARGGPNAPPPLTTSLSLPYLAAHPTHCRCGLGWAHLHASRPWTPPGTSCGRMPHKRPCRCGGEG